MILTPVLSGVWSFIYHSLLALTTFLVLFFSVPITPLSFYLKLPAWPLPIQVNLFLLIFISCCEHVFSFILFCCSFFCVSFLKCSFSHIKLLQSCPFKSVSMRLKGISPYSSILIYHLILLLLRSLCVAWLYVFQIMSASHRMDFTFLEDFLSMLTYVTVLSELNIHVNDLRQLVNSNLASWFYQFLSPFWIQGPYRKSVP